jgi:Ca-activated chloride channel family protein
MWPAIVEWFSTIHFLHPGWLWAWLPAVAVVALLLGNNLLGPLARLPEAMGVRRYRHPRLGILRKLNDQQLTRQAARGAFRHWAHYAVVLLCVHVALAQPYRLGKQLPKPPEYRDTIFLVDTSVNMLLRDYVSAGKRIERMTMLKSVLTHFIDNLHGNRIGLVVFSEQPYTLVPLTSDYALLDSMVRRLEPAVLTGRTPDIARVLLYVLQQSEKAHSANGGQKPVLVLLTGANQTYSHVDPSAVAAYLHAQGYRLYTVGIGASSYKAGETGKVGLVYEPANFALMKSIAKRGGGKFYWADSAGSLRAAIEAIQSAGLRQVKVTPRYVRMPLYQWPLLIGLLGLVIPQLIFRPGRRR